MPGVEIIEAKPVVEVAGGIILALVVLFIGIPLALRVFAALGEILPFLILGAIILGLIGVFGLGNLVAFSVIAGGIVAFFYAFAKLQDRCNGSVFDAIIAACYKFLPITGPQDPRHPEYLDWANRRGKYASRPSNPE